MFFFSMLRFVFSTLQMVVRACVGVCVCVCVCVRVCVCVCVFSVPCEILFTVIQPCDYIPCEHGGKCSNLGITYKCSCRNNYIGTNCESMRDGIYYTTLHCYTSLLVCIVLVL